MTAAPHDLNGADAAAYAPMAAVDAWVAAPDDTNRPMPA